MLPFDCFYLYHIYFIMIKLCNNFEFWVRKDYIEFTICLFIKIELKLYLFWSFIWIKMFKHCHIIREETYTQISDIEFTYDNNFVQILDILLNQSIDKFIVFQYISCTTINTIHMKSNNNYIYISRYNRCNKQRNIW